VALESGMKDGQLYEGWSYAKCDPCRTWWRRRFQARYHMMSAAGDGLPYETGYGEHVAYLTEWERSPEAGSSFALWTRPEDAERGGCPTCTAAAAQMTLDAPAPVEDEACGECGRAPEWHDDDGTCLPVEATWAPTVEQEAEWEAENDEREDELVPGFARFVEQLDPRAGTAQVVELMREAGIDPGDHNRNWLANQATFAAIELRRDQTPRVGEQLTLA
jgi:hypothetical protein